MKDAEQTASLMKPGKLGQPRPQAAVPAGQWLDRMAADVGADQVAHLVQLLRALGAPAAADLTQPVSERVATLQSELSQVDFELVKSRGWIARTLGKGRDAGAEFAERYERCLMAARELALHADDMQKKHLAGKSASERPMVEIEVEYRALDRTVEQGTRWLHDMREQLRASHAAATTPEALQQVKSDAARCELLVARLKLLRATSAAAQQWLEQSKAVDARRTALLKMLQAAVAGSVKNWSGRVGALAAAGASGSSGPALSLEGPTEVHALLRKQLEHAATACAQLLADEAALAGATVALGEQFAAANQKS